MIRTGIFIGIIFCITVIAGCSGSRPTTIGIVDGNLTPCPSKPNCVSSTAEDKKHFCEPFKFSVNKSAALNCLKSIIQAQPRATIVTETENYLHVEFKTALFRFVDDVEFFIPENESVIHIRSASRLGHSDLGLNKKRMNKLRSIFYDKLKDK